MAGPQQVALVFSGGIGLGAYQAGAFEQLSRVTDFSPTWLAGASIGAVNAALIAGSAPDERMQTLRQFWLEPPSWWNGSSVVGESAFPHINHWANVAQSRLFGAPGFFRPRLPGPLTQSFKSLYDLSPMRSRLASLVDFDRLNGGDLRLTVATTDIESAEPVLFDTGTGDRIELDHVMASCGYLPEFAPIEIGGRLLGDGGLAGNAPIEPVLREGSPELVFVLDLFAPDSRRPESFEAALARKNDLLFAAQTLGRLRAWCEKADREERQILYLSYRAPADEAGPEKPYDFSLRTLRRRWQAGALDMQEAISALQMSPRNCLTMVRREEDRDPREQADASVTSR